MCKGCSRSGPRRAAAASPYTAKSLLMCRGSLGRLPVGQELQSPTAACSCHHAQGYQAAPSVAGLSPGGRLSVGQERRLLPLLPTASRSAHVGGARTWQVSICPAGAGLLPLHTSGSPPTAPEGPPTPSCHCQPSGESRRLPPVRWVGQIPSLIPLGRKQLARSLAATATPVAVGNPGAPALPVGYGYPPIRCT
jgi:hypothetical protein